MIIACKECEWCFMGSNELKSAKDFYSAIDACAQCGSESLLKFWDDDDYFASIPDGNENEK